MGRMDQRQGRSRSARPASAGRERRALEAFFAAHLPALRSWAGRRVPRRLERRADADDFVQLAAIRTLARLHHLAPERRETMQPYLRRVVINLVRDEIRKVGRSPELIAVDGDLDAAGIVVTPLDALVGRATWETYKAALKALDPRDRKCIVGRVQKGLSYPEIARLIGAPSPGAARVAVSRAIDRLMSAMRARSG